ncbi:PilZ domain-containing protein [Aurantiacibacter sp. MUD11]|uniref:PilZ domain-containing protein n=1 Tax=Aurantiacibacter sp. MUD11 TaxID=3003265 RepID=UPI0022AB26C0|nr:PilZ domain-containing protein [Aurantiacibacter sp. MUD11]WAT19246.1 PilZ domain-containing protein [Aurantiacibacter sp. MUD11]
MQQEADKVRAKVRAKTGGSVDLLVLDLSAGGCMVEFHGSAARPGERVLVTLPGLSALPGELVWAEDGRAGIAFEAPLHETVFDRLKQMLTK